MRLPFLFIWLILLIESNFLITTTNRHTEPIVKILTNSTGHARIFLFLKILTKFTVSEFNQPVRHKMV